MEETFDYLEVDNERNAENNDVENYEEIQQNQNYLAGVAERNRLIDRYYR